MTSHLGTAPGSVSMVRICELIARMARLWKQFTNIKIFFVFLCKSHLKYNPIDDCIDGAAVIEQDNIHDHKSKQEISLDWTLWLLILLCIEDQQPREESTEHTTDVFNAPKPTSKAPAKRHFIHVNTIKRHYLLIFTYFEICWQIWECEAPLAPSQARHSSSLFLCWVSLCCCCCCCCWESDCEWN